MFLRSDHRLSREKKVRRYLTSEPGISLLLAAVNFEWTLGRAVRHLHLSSPGWLHANSELLSFIKKCSGLTRYKELWEKEVVGVRQCSSLHLIVCDWNAVMEAFMQRHVLVHGRDRYTKKMAEPHVEALIAGANDIDKFCESLGCPLNARIPIRRRRAAA